jgi:hypothetical protein
VVSLNLWQPLLPTKVAERVFGSGSAPFEVLPLGLVEHEGPIEIATKVLEAFQFNVDCDRGFDFRRDTRHARIVDEK